ncbi:unnamed protein product [Heligmosomoides polygyrus]|uniref:LRRcap domain-containing protein n=1 Tax=Heligmosomoides polygyrus TaxID=6339 RepID=A0A183F983_HELPZ|nr:unnamed protein product [Heligmosomoides polygyrus]
MQYGCYDHSKMSVTVEEVPEKPVEDADAAAEEEDVIEVDRDTTSLDLTRTRLKKIEGFEFLKKIKSLCLRWNLLKKIEGLDTLTTLTELDLYDNQVWRERCGTWGSHLRLRLYFGDAATCHRRRRQILWRRRRIRRRKYDTPAKPSTTSLATLCCVDGYAVQSHNTASATLATRSIT